MVNNRLSYLALTSCNAAYRRAYSEAQPALRYELAALLRVKASAGVVSLEGRA